MEDISLRTAKTEMIAHKSADIQECAQSAHILGSMAHLGKGISYLSRMNLSGSMRHDNVRGNLCSYCQTQVNFPCLFERGFPVMRRKKNA